MAPRTFISFSGTDIRSFWLMKAWKENEHIDVDFVDCQVDQEIHSTNESYIKSVCRERIGMAGTFVLLIGADTKSRHTYVRWECEVAIAQEARLIGVNLNGARALDDLCPPIFRKRGAIFIPFKPAIFDHTLRRFTRKEPGDDWNWPPKVYADLGIS